jgi:thioredoxin 1
MKYIQTLEELDKLLENNGKIIIMFSAKWCGPCKKLTPDIENLENENLSIYKVDVDDFDDLTQYQINGLPTFLFYDNGIMVDRYLGSKIEDIHKRLKFIIS